MKKILLTVALLSLPLNSFAEVNLQSTLDMAFDYSPALKYSIEGKNSAAFEVDRAKSAYYPRLDLSANGGFTQRNDVVTRANKEDDDFQALGDFSLLLTQPLYTGGRTTANIKSQKSNLEAQQNLVLDSANSLAFEAISAHVDVIRRSELVSLAQKNIVEHEKILAMIQERYKSGVASSGDVTQIEARLSRAKSTLFSNEANLEAALATYERITGVRPSDKLASVAPPKKIYTNPEEVKNISLEFNPRLQTTKAGIAIAEGNEAVSKSNFYPNIDLQAGPRYHNQAGKSYPENYGWEALVRMQWNFYNGGGDKAGLSSSKAKVRQARYELLRFMDQLEQDIYASYSRMQASQKQSIEYDNARQSALSTRENFLGQFQAGNKSLLDVLDAENDVYTYSSEQIMSATESLIGHYRLLALAGELFNELGLNKNYLVSKE